MLYTTAAPDLLNASGVNVTACPAPGPASPWVTAQWVVLRVLMPSVSALGAVGNTLTIAVLTRRWMKSSTNHYLTALAVCDLVYLLAASALTLRLPQALDTAMLYVKPVGDTCSNTAVLLTLTFTVERYIAVGYPLLGRRLCTPRRARYAIGGVALLAVVVTAPGFFQFSAVVRACGGPKWRESAFGASAAFQRAYVPVNQTTFTFLPLTLLFIFNILLLRSVARAFRQRRQLSQPTGHHHTDHREQTRITVMLIVVVFVFLVCQLPQALMNLVSQRGRRRPPAVNFALSLANLLVMLNAAVNFVLYSAFSAKFRRTFADYVRCRRRKVIGGNTREPRTEQSRHLVSKAGDGNQRRPTARLTRETPRASRT